MDSSRAAVGIGSGQGRGLTLFAAPLAGSGLQGGGLRPRFGGTLAGLGCGFLDQRQWGGGSVWCPGDSRAWGDLGIDWGARWTAKVRDGSIRDGPWEPHLPQLVTASGSQSGPKSWESHPPTVMTLVVGLAGSRGHPAARAKAGPPHFPLDSGTPKGPRRPAPLCIAQHRNAEGCCNLDPKLFFLCKFCPANHPLFFLIKDQKRRRRKKILPDSLIVAFRAGTSWGWGCLGPGWGALVCLLQSLLSLRETDTCTKRHFHFFFFF